MALAASKGNLYALQLLLHYGADPNLKDFRGTSPLRCAFEAKQYDIIPALAVSGANVKETCLVSHFLIKSHCLCVTALFSQKSTQNFEKITHGEFYAWRNAGIAFF